MRNREENRSRWNDPEFNKWLDEGITDCGHTVWDSVPDIGSAWNGWDAAKSALGFYCPSCAGSGEEIHVSYHGPDSFERLGSCSACKGDGRTTAALDAANARIAEMQEELNKLQAESWRLRTAEGDSMTYKAGMENCAQQRDQAKAEVERISKRLKWNEEWNAGRFETLFHWAHRELSEDLKTQYFNIVANGSSSPMDPPTYAQQMNRLKWKAEAADKERDMLLVELGTLRKALTTIREESHDIGACECAADALIDSRKVKS